MMAWCLLAASSYLPLYHAMQRVAGSQVVTAISQRNPVTGAIALTPQTEVNGVLQPAAAPVEAEPAVAPALLDKLQALDPDALTPKQALDALYEIRKLLDE